MRQKGVVLGWKECHVVETEGCHVGPSLVVISPSESRVAKFPFTREMLPKFLNIPGIGIVGALSPQCPWHIATEVLRVSLGVKGQHVEQECCRIRAGEVDLTSVKLVQRLNETWGWLRFS